LSFTLSRRRRCGRRYTLAALGNSSLDLVYNCGLGERAQITQLITLARNDLAHDTAHNLARARLGKVVHDVDLLGRREGANDFADLEHELLVQTGLVVRVVLEFAEGGQKWEWEKNRQFSDGTTKVE
jgi:hypothetical protein